MNTKIAITSLALAFGFISAKAQQFWSPVSGAPVSISDHAFRTGKTYIGEDPSAFSGVNTDVSLHAIEKCGGYEFQISRIAPGLEGCLVGHISRPYMRIVDWSFDAQSSAYIPNSRFVADQHGQLGIGDNIPDAVPTSFYIRKNLLPSQNTYEATRIHSISDDGEERILRGHTRLSASAYNFMTKDGDFGLIFSDGGESFNQNAGFVIAPHTDGEGGLRIDNIGRVNIGKWFEPSSSGGFEYELSVKGGILTEEIKVALWSDWPDYVFADGYKLRSIEELEDFIAENKHLPGMPSAQEVADNKGVELGEMNRLLLEKVEELTLYILELKQENRAFSNRLSTLENE